MAKTIGLLLICISIFNIYAVCPIERNSTWLEISEAQNKLQMYFRDDRNVFISYVLNGNRMGPLLSHRIYACSGTRLYLVNDDDYVELFANVEVVDENSIKMTFVEKNKELGMIELKRQ